MSADTDARASLEQWLRTERDDYAHTPATGKWADPAAAAAHVAAVQRTGPTTWEDWAGNYIRRAVLWGLETPQGRQALGKAIVTLCHFLETAVDTYGPMPRPGLPSGDIQQWDGPA